MKKDLTMLIIEDDENHRTDAEETLKKYHHLNALFATTLEEGREILASHSLDSAIVDVIFPGKEPVTETCENALLIARELEAKNIPLVYNTAGNHHGYEYRHFLRSRHVVCDGFGTGKLIEAYPEDDSEEALHKQWWAAINYAILLAFAKRLSAEERNFINSFIPFAAYGDYGQLTKTIQKVLTKNLEESALNKIYQPPYPWSRDALKAFDKKLDCQKKWWEWDEENNRLISLRPSKAQDEKIFQDLETGFKGEYEKGFSFIRETLNFYFRESEAK